VVFFAPEGLTVPEGPRLEALLRRLDHGTVLRATPEVLAAVATTETPQGVCMALARPRLKWAIPKTRLFLILDGIKDPGNLGTLVRSAAAAGCGGVLLVNGCTDPWAPKAVRSSMGATLRVPIKSIPDWASALELLDDSGGQIMIHAADAGGERAYYEVGNALH